jgi:beta-galactosidase
MAARPDMPGDTPGETGRRLPSRRALLATAAGGALVAPLAPGAPRAAAAVPGGTPADRSGTAGTPQSAGPEYGSYELNHGWLFGRYDAGATTAGADEGGLDPVTLPHTVTPLSWRNWDARQWQDRWVYRRHLDGDRLRGDGGDARVFLDFDGVMTSATLAVNGVEIASHRGGYLPWSVELTGRLGAGDNVAAVVVDARWQQVPPDGAADGAKAVDYLQPGGIYRDVRLRVTPPVFLSDVFAKPLDVLDDSRRRVEVTCTVDAGRAGTAEVTVDLHDGARRLATAAGTVHVDAPGTTTFSATLTDLGDITLWEPGSPQLYTVTATVRAGRARHAFTRRIGFREARFEVDGFYLNGRHTKVFGLNRHQLFPFLGMAAPARVQRRDAELLAGELNCLMVRCSHYPQSPHFLDACDELGLLVWQEVPGWQYVGDAAWQEQLVQDTHDMVVRDRNRPSVIVWGTRANETPNEPELYRRTRALADALDGTRATSGAMIYHATDGWAQDVFSYDDYHTDGNGNAILLPPLPDVPYLVSEAVGALDGPKYYRWTDTSATLAAQARLHAQVHEAARADDRYAGLLGWAGIDYASYTGNTWQSVKWPGVVDGFRVPKPGAAFYRSQVDPRRRVVIAPTFFWDFGPGGQGGAGPEAMVATNCDRLEFYVGGAHLTTGRPDTARFGHLAHPPVFADLTVADPAARPELRIEGYIGERRAAVLRMSADPAHDRLALAADDAVLQADGSDATRVVFRAVDAYGNQRPGVTGDVTLSLTGPAVLAGDNPFAFGDYGGVGGAWLRTVPWQTGRVTLTAEHAVLGRADAHVTVVPPDSARRFF